MKRLLLLFALTAGALMLVASPALTACHVVDFVGAPYQVSESAGKVTITVTNGGGGGAGTTNYQTSNGTAKAGQDYSASHGTVVWVPGTADESFEIRIIDDGKHESNETFKVTLSHPTGCVTTLPDQPATVTIVDDDKMIQPTPTPTKTSPKPSPRPSPSVTPTPTPTPSPTQSTVAAADEGGGLSGGAVAGIVIGTLAVGGAAAYFVRRRFLT